VAVVERYLEKDLNFVCLLLFLKVVVIDGHLVKELLLLLQITVVERYLMKELLLLLRAAVVDEYLMMNLLLGLLCLCQKK